MSANLIICHRCDDRQKSCDGSCLCTVNGRDIIENAQANECPKGLFPRDNGKQHAHRFVSAVQRIALPGDVLEAALKRLGADKLARWWERMTGVPCGCEERKQAINRATIKLKTWLKV